MSCGHREQPKIGEEGIWPLFVIVQTSPLTLPVLLFAQLRLQSTPNKAVDRREGVAVGRRAVFGQVLKTLPQR